MTEDRCRTVIDHVRVFTDSGFGGLQTVTIEGARIVAVDPARSSSDPQRADHPGDVRVDGAGGFLVPGFIDAHAHVSDEAALKAYARWGVTTVLDLGSPRPATVRVLRDARNDGRPDVLMAGLPASAPGGLHVKKAGFPPASAVTDAEDARRFVAEQVAEGVDYIKVIVEDPKMPGTKALSVDTVAAIVRAAHDAGRVVLAHAVTATAVVNAAESGVDVVTHAPLDRPLDDEQTRMLAARGVILLPTLVMMRDVATELMARVPLRVLSRLRIAPRLDLAHALQTVREHHRLGGVVLVGTDANDSSFAPAHPAYGAALHEELALLIEAGMTPLEVLLSATARTAEVFGLTDRGSIAVDKRADLVLLARDPSSDISATTDILSCWVAGNRTTGRLGDTR